MDINQILLKAVHHTTDGITLADCQQNDAPLAYVNDAFLQMTGYSREEVLGKNCRFLQGEDTDHAVRANIIETIATQSEGVFIIKNYRKNGTAFWNRLTLTPIRDEADQLCYYCGVQTDVTPLFENQNNWQLYQNQVTYQLDELSSALRALSLSATEKHIDPLVITEIDQLRRKMAIIRTMNETQSCDILDYLRPNPLTLQ